MATGKRDPRLTNRQGLLAARASAGQDTLERMDRLLTARAAAEAAFAKELRRLADSDDKAQAAQAHLMRAGDPTADTEAAAALSSFADGCRAEASVREDYAQFLRDDVLKRVAAVTEGIRTKRADLEVRTVRRHTPPCPLPSFPFA